MEQWEMLSKVIRYQKAVTDNAFTIISIFQNSGEQVLKTALDQQSWIPDKGRKDFLSWSNNYLQITTNMKTFFNKSYEEFERFVEQPAAKTAREPKEPPAQQAPPAKQISPEKTSSPELKQKVAAKKPAKKPAAARKKSSSPNQNEEKPQPTDPVRTSKPKEESSKQSS